MAIKFPPFIRIDKGSQEEGAGCTHTLQDITVSFQNMLSAFIYESPDLFSI